MRRRRFLCFALPLCCAAAALAQITGNIEGRVSDSAGGPLPGVTVEATSPNLQGTRVATSGRDGLYRIPAVPPGVYRIQATLSLFAPAEKTATVSLDATATADFTLHLAAQETVVVSGEASLVDVTSTTTGTTYTTDVIAHLPVSRNYADILRSNPGVDVDRGELQGRSLALTIYGATSVENQWIIDGVTTTNVVKGFQSKAINNEFVQEVEVKTGGYQAEYGRALGGVINVITKSGGNQFHGDAFLYYDSFETRAKQVVTDQDSVTASMRISDYRRRDFGADLGGFLLKDRLWFFAAYDRVEFPAKVSRYVSSELVPNTLKFPLDVTDNLYSGKLTWNIAPGSTVVATAFADPTVNAGAGGADPRQGGLFTTRPITNPDPSTWQANRYLGGTDYGLRFNQLFGPVGLLTLQGSHHEDRYDLKAPGLVRLEDLTCGGGTPTTPCNPPPEPNFVTGGYGFVFGGRNRNLSRRNEYRADLSLFLGNHEIKLGGSYQDSATQAITYFTGGQLVTRFNELGQIYYQHFFLATSPSDLTPVENSSQRPRTKDLGAFVQDSWKIAPGWTVNAGLRWDEEDIRNQSDETVIKTAAEWQPRLGVIWDPKGDGKTKIYAFAGRFYYALPTDLTLLSFGNQTFAITYNFDPVSTAQSPNVLGHESARASGGFITPVDAGLKGIYQDEYTVGVEKSLSATFSLGVKATYRRFGRAIEDRCDLDYSRPETDFNNCGIVNPGSGGKIARGDIPGCNGLDGDSYQCTETIPATPPARRLYRGIEILARKSSERLWLQASYVYSSLRGNYDGEVSALGGGGQTDPGINADFDYPALYHNSYGKLFLDRPHRLRLDGYYITPFKLSVGLQAFIRSGAPLNKLGYFNAFDGFLGFSPVQLVKKGYAGRLPATWEANLTFAYPIVFGPVTVTAQAYLYNLFNNQVRTSQDTRWSIYQPSGYPASIYDPNQENNNPDYGKITSRQDPRLFRAAMKISF